MYKVPEKYRAKLDKSSPYCIPEGELQGVFMIPKPHAAKIIIYCVATPANELVPWDHVSVSISHVKGKNLGRCPTWEEMCLVKDLFWDKDDVVVQIHPEEKDYVSQHHYCLHLWKKAGDNMEVPPSEAVGFVKGQNLKG